MQLSSIILFQVRPLSYVRDFIVIPICSIHNQVYNEQFFNCVVFLWKASDNQILFLFSLTLMCQVNTYRNWNPPIKAIMWIVDHQLPCMVQQLNNAGIMIYVIQVSSSD